MSRDKQTEIVEMAIEVSNAHHELDVAWTNHFADSANFPKPKGENNAIAEHLYEKGYRKASDVARRIFDEIFAAYDDCIHIDEREIGHLKVGKFLECLVNIGKKYTESEVAE